ETGKPGGEVMDVMDPMLIGDLAATPAVPPSLTLDWSVLGRQWTPDPQTAQRNDDPDDGLIF
ncbi:MAG: hypothetical protein AAFX09_13810, partial [Pseudomonadota bacterium]